MEKGDSSRFNKRHLVINSSEFPDQFETTWFPKAVCLDDHCQIVWESSIHLKMSNSMWSIFPATASSQRIDVIDSPHIRDSARICHLASRTLFTQSIQFVSQDEQLFDKVRGFVANENDFGFVLIRDMPLYALISPYFINAYLQQGLIYGLSGLFTNLIS